MKISILADIHGNCVALDAALADLQLYPVDRVVCLGDAIQGGPQPAQVAARLRQLACPVVMGNADAWLLSGEESGREQISSERLRKMQAVREWSLSQLSVDDQAFIASFQPAIEIPLLNDRTLLCFHGSPDSFDDVILPQLSQDEFERFLGKYAAHILTGGHTHLQQLRRIGNNFFFNPGSVGFAYSPTQAEDAFRADPWAEYAVLQIEDEHVGLEFRRVPFDIHKLARAYRESGRPFAEEAIEQYLP